MGSETGTETEREAVLPALVAGARDRLRRTPASRAAAACVRFRRRRERDAVLGRLRADEDAAIAAVGRALTAAVAEPRPEERAWIERIESLRAELGRSQDTVRTPRAEWTADAADEGQVRETPVSRLALELSKPSRWGRVLLNLARELRPRRTLELGTCVGLSTAYQVAGLEVAGAAGSVVTLEAASARVALAEANLGRLTLGDRVEARSGRFEETLDDALDQAGGIDFAFVDGHHRRGPTIDYFERITARFDGPGVILFDDIGWSPGMRLAWDEISVHPRVRLAADLHGLGLCVARGGAEEDGGVPHKLELILHP